MDSTPETIDAAVTTEAAPRKARRGFAAMDPDKVREIAKRGGRAAHAAGTAHRFSHEEAVTAGRAGGKAEHTTRGRRPKIAPQG